MPLDVLNTPQQQTFPMISDSEAVLNLFFYRVLNIYKVSRRPEVFIRHPKIKKIKVKVFIVPSISYYHVDEGQAPHI